MEKDYGITMNMSAVTSKDGKLSFGVKMKDSNGLNYDIKKENLDIDKIDWQELVGQVKKELEQQEKSQKVEDNSLEGRLKRLEKENEKLRKQLEQTRLEKQAMRTSTPVVDKKAENKKAEEKPTRRNSYDLFDRLLWDFSQFDKFLFN